MNGSGLSVGVDIGGTFTDCTIMHDAGRITTGKSPTTPEDRSRGFFDAIESAATNMGATLESVMERCDLLVHGTTTGTNAIVERRGAATGLLATRGHDDVMFVMKGQGRTSGLSPDEALDVHATRRPEPLVPRAMVFPITERIDVDGEVIVPLDEDDVRDAVRELVSAGAEALTISFLWSTMNPVHEHRARAIAAEVAPDLFISCSSDLSTRTGEYERTTTAVMNSYIGPLMVDYVDRIQNGARQRGFPGSVQFAQCAGGAITSAEARRAPVRTVHSGPVAGTIAMARIAERIGLRNVIAVDMGGTTFDVSVIHDGRPLQRDISIFERYAMALPMLDIESIGAGGGSIAWIDDVGRLNVGPRSAGARPGPACYGFGGTDATVTDADVVLGLVNPDNYLGGRMTLDRDLAEEAVDRLALRLGMSRHETAAGISTVVDAKMADLVRRMSLLRGLDPRNFACAAFGGGGPLHAPAVAAQAAISSLVVPLPRAASVLSAYGAATSDVVHVVQRWRVLGLPVPGATVEEIFAALESEAHDKFAGQGIDMAGVALERSVRMRFSMQIHDVEVPVPGGRIDDGAVALIDQRFEDVHDQLFGRGSGDRTGGVDFTAFQVRATAKTGRAELTSDERREALQRSRPVYWSELRDVRDTPIYEEVPAAAIDGPALIELPDTVIVVRPGQRGAPDMAGNYLIDLRAQAS
jgi:N-methylhydantoinase A